MKVKELIAQLQKTDEDCEVVVGGKAIHFVEQVEGYWDGPYEVLIEDESKKPFYSVIGGKVTTKGDKVRLFILPIEDALYSCNTANQVDDFILEYDLTSSSTVNQSRINHYEKLREQIKWFQKMMSAKEDSPEYFEFEAKWKELGGSD